MKIIGILLLIAALNTAAWAQSLSPLVVECGKRCSGQFTVGNSQLDYLTATIEPWSFRLSPEGKTIFEPLAGAVVELKQTSARIPPRSSWDFDYSIRCSSPPCQVALVVAMVTGKPREDGLTVRILIPEVVYACDKAKNCRKDQRRAAGLAN